MEQLLSLAGTNHPWQKQESAEEKNCGRTRVEWMKRLLVAGSGYRRTIAMTERKKVGGASWTWPRLKYYSFTAGYETTKRFQVCLRFHWGVE